MMGAAGYVIVSLSEILHCSQVILELRAMMTVKSSFIFSQLEKKRTASHSNRVQEDEGSRTRTVCVCVCSPVKVPFSLFQH